jgi:hypothetical protein
MLLKEVLNWFVHVKHELWDKLETAATLAIQLSHQCLISLAG